MQSQYRLVWLWMFWSMEENYLKAFTSILICLNKWLCYFKLLMTPTMNCLDNNNNFTKFMLDIKWKIICANKVQIDVYLHYRHKVGWSATFNCIGHLVFGILIQDLGHTLFEVVPHNVTLCGNPLLSWSVGCVRLITFVIHGYTYLFE